MIIDAYRKNKRNGKASVLATVVALEGTSYRQPGVRMLIGQDGVMIGAVSGGCVEKEIYRQSISVFKDSVPKMMTYDGRFRLGCEGILYILIEPINLDDAFIDAFEKCIENRESLLIKSYFKKQDQLLDVGFGTRIEVGVDSTFAICSDKRSLLPTELGDFSVFEQRLYPALKLVIIGAEHDAVQLCNFASLSGWEVCVIATDSDPKQLENFPGAKAIINTRPELFDTNIIDDRTALMLMTHSYSKDFQYLLKLETLELPYIGLLGPSKRRERMLNEIIEQRPEVAMEFFETIHGPAGINIGAETPQEIAISILAEMLSVFRQQQVIPLKHKKGRIHS